MEGIEFTPHWLKWLLLGTPVRGMAYSEARPGLSPADRRHGRIRGDTTLPASRSRTNEWKRSLQQVFDRGGAIEFAVARPDASTETDDPHDHAAGIDLVWRVKVLKLTENEMIVEAPMALGRQIEIEPKIELVASIAIGQNRWMFRTRNLGTDSETSQKSRSHRSLRLALPENVRRCQRRAPRYDTRDMKLPEVEVWPLLDPKTVIPAEHAVALAWDGCRSGSVPEGDVLGSDTVMPSIGPRFTATLMNLGGGGVGLRVDSEASQLLNRHRVFWIKVPLEPELPLPLYVTGKVVHTHIDSMQRTYAGVAFDFTFNHAHEKLVAEQIQFYIERIQASQREAHARSLESGESSS